eukprot:138955_1
MEICEDLQDKCMVCYESNNPETIVKCKECSLTVHFKCYGVTAKSFDQWKCRYCIYTEEQNIDTRQNNYTIKCRICNQKTFGALKPCANNDGFAHLICALWTPFIYVRNQYHMSPIHNIQKCKEYKNILETLHCMVCGKNCATIKCRVKSCKYHYHPSCLIGTTDKNQNKCMIKQNFTINKMHSAMYYVYCRKHARLHQPFDPLRVTRSDRKAEFHQNNFNANMPKNEEKTIEKHIDDVEMYVFNENKMDFNKSVMNNMNEWNNDMFNDNDTVYNNQLQDNNYLQQRSAFGRELSPAFCSNNYVYKMGSETHIHKNVMNEKMGNIGIQSNNSVDMESGIISQPQIFRSNATTPSTIVSAMSTSKSRAPMPFMNGFEQLQQQQMEYHTHQMRQNNNNNNNPNINFASFF